MNATTTDQALVKCSNCRVNRPPENFVGARGGVVKRCQKCRDKDARQKQKPDVIQKRNDRQRERKYYKAYRAKKLEENPEEHRRHNADVMKAWRDNNKERLSNWWATNLNFRLSHLKDQGIKKGYVWADDMTKETCAAMMTSPCFYCDYLSMGKSVNGIDRLDNNVGYMKSNCVGCCKFCNFIKKCLDPRTFVERCLHISACHGHGTAKHPDAWPDRQPSPYSDYKLRAEQKGLVFELSREAFDAMTEMPCHYCERQITATNKSGVDRVNNKLGYTTGNTRPCCSECNSMKTSLSVDDFIGTCQRVAAKADRLTLPENIPRCYRVITKRRA